MQYLLIFLYAVFFGFGFTFIFLQLTRYLRVHARNPVVDFPELQDD